MLIDVHSHVSPLDFPLSPARDFASRWPCMKCSDDARTGTLMVGDKAFRQLDDRSWRAERRIDDMDRDGVTIQVISPMPELLSYWLAPDAAAILCDHSNDQIAGLVTTHPNRFRGLGSVCLQRPDQAIAQLHRIKHVFGLSGVEIGSNIDGKMLGHADFDPFFAAAEALELAVFVHALHPIVTKAADLTPAYVAFAGFPIDVAMAIASITMVGLIERFPRLRIGFSHGGGAIGGLLGRLDKGWQTTEGFAGAAATLPSEQLRRMFIDSNVYDPAHLLHLARDVAPERVFVGTDYPYLVMQENVADFVAAAGLHAAERSSLLAGAARAFLGEPELAISP